MSMGHREKVLTPQSKWSPGEATEFPGRVVGSESWTEPQNDSRSPVRETFKMVEE